MSGGRPRDEALDESIIEHAAALLLEEGFDGFSIARVAQRAGTTRPALYRRFPSGSLLAIAALHAIATGTKPDLTGDHLHDLEAELRSFRDGATRTNSITLVGSMLTANVEPDVLETFRELMVRPRRERIAEILHHAKRDRLVTGDRRDLEIATTMCTGSFYAFALAGIAPPTDWPRRTARLVWRAAGGTVTPNG